MDSLAALFEDEEEGEEVSEAIKKGSVMSFLYLEVLDASFSFDGVIGAFAITQDVVIIMLGLGDWGDVCPKPDCVSGAQGYFG